MESLIRRALIISLVGVLCVPPLAFAQSNAEAATASSFSQTDVQTLGQLNTELSLQASFPLISGIVPLLSPTLSSSLSTITSTQDLAQKRAELMLDAAKNNPQAFLANAVSDTVRSKLPAAIQNDVEQKITVTGTLSVLSVDDFTNEQNSHFDYQLTTSDGTTLEVYPVIPGVMPSPSTSVTITGYRLENAIVPDMDPTAIQTVQSQIVGSTTLPIDESTGTQQILVIPIIFSDNTQKMPATGKISQVLFSGPFSSYYTEQSYGHLTITGKVLPWVTIAGSDQSGCTTVTLNTPEIQQMVLSQKIKLNNYRDVLFLFGSSNYGDGCAYVGRVPVTFNGTAYTLGEAWVGKGATIPTLTSDPFPWNTDLSVAAHEIGHTLGLMHANGWDCGTQAIYGTCSHVEYGNEYDAMAISRGFTLDFNAYYKEQLGWFPTGGLTVATSGLYTLRTYESTTTPATRYLKIQNPALTALGVYDTPYYLEFRQSVGFDQLPAAYSSTVNLAGGLLNKVIYPNGYPFTRLVDSQPTAASWFTDIQNAAISASTTVSDAGKGISITGMGVLTNRFDSASSTSKYTITLSKPTCQSFAPTVDPGNTYGPSSLNAGQTSYFGFYANDVNYSGCGLASDSISAPSLPAGWTLVTPSQNIPVQPDSMANVYAGVLAPATTTPGVYNFSLQITDTRTNKSSVYPFTVTVYAPLVITSHTPRSGLAGARVILYGTGFSTANNMIFIPTPSGDGYAEFDPIASTGTDKSGIRKIIFNFPTTFTLFAGGTEPTPPGVYTFGVYSLDSQTQSNNIQFTVTGSDEQVLPPTGDLQQDSSSTLPSSVTTSTVAPTTSPTASTTVGS